MPHHVATLSLQNMLNDAASMNVNVDDVFDSLNLPFSAADLRKGKPPKIRADQFSMLYKILHMRMINVSHRIDGRNDADISEFTLMCHCVITAESLLEVFNRLRKFYGLMSERYPDHSAELVLDGNLATFAFDYGSDQIGKLQAGTETRVLRTTHFFLSWLIGKQITLDSIALRWPKSLAVPEEICWFNCPESYCEPHNGLTFSASYLNMPIVRTPAQLKVFLKYFPGMMAGFPASHRALLSTQVKQLMLSGYMDHHHFPSLAEVANLFSRATSTLSKDLRLEQCSYASIKKECQIELSMGYLDNPQFTIDEISAFMGYEDSNSFRRAFRLWTGTTPGQYRSQKTSASEVHT